MPITREHLQRASQNLAFAQSFDLEHTPYIDWAVTAYFYAALHLVDALLFHKEQLHGGAHEQRWVLIKSKDYLVGIKDEYRILRGKTDNARYDLITFTSIKVTKEVVPLYRSIEQHILQQLPKETVEQYRWLTRPKAEASSY